MSAQPPSWPCEPSQRAQPLSKSTASDVVKSRDRTWGLRSIRTEQESLAGFWGGRQPCRWWGLRSRGLRGTQELMQGSVRRGEPRRPGFSGTEWGARG